MFAKLTGYIDSLGPDHVVLDVNGMGFLLFVSGRTLQSIENASEKKVFHVEPVIRQEYFSLFGFTTAEEKYWFKILLGVQGVGARVALSLLSHFDPNQLAQFIAQENKAQLSLADGVGPKLASRLVTELKDKATKYNIIAFDDALKGGIISTSSVGDAISALKNLGYRENDIQKSLEIIKKMNDIETMDTSEIIRHCFSFLSPGIVEK